MATFMPSAVKSLNMKIKEKALINSQLQSFLTLVTIINVSRTLTAVSLRLFAKFLCDLADVLEISKAAFDDEKFKHEADNYTDTVADSSKTNSSSEASLEERYNQLLESTRLSLQESNMELKSTEDNIRIRTDSTDSGLGDDIAVLDFLDEDTGLPIISLAEVNEHCTSDDAWTVIYDKVYDITEYMSLHPGGEEVMMEYVGYDSTVAFRGVAHSKAAFRALNKYCVGILPYSERLNYDPCL